MSPRRTRELRDTAGRKQKSVVSRFGWVFLLCTLASLAIAGMLFHTTVVVADDWRMMGDSTLYSVKPIEPMRGDILASDGSILATNIYYHNVMMDLRAEGFKIIEFNEALPALCDSLAKYYPPYDAKLWREKFDVQMNRTKSKRTRNFVLARAVTDRDVNRIKTFPFFAQCPKQRHNGLKTDPILKRAYPFGKMARLSIGRVGMTHECSEVHGRSGLECALDTLLYGRAGTKVRGRAGMRETKFVVDTPAVRGCDVFTTINITIQDILESELSAMILDTQAEWGAAMIMQVDNGDIVAMSNLEPDPDSRAPRTIEALNRCVLAYEPGSVMKVMSMALGLKKGYAVPSRVYPIGRVYNYLNRPIRDTHSPGELPVEQFLEYSSNIGMVKMTIPHYTSDPAAFKRDLEEMGFFDTFNTGIAGETKPRFIKEPKLIDLSRMIFGYTTAIPPLYTCAFYNAIANDGRFVRPRMVRGIRTPDGVDSLVPVTYVRDPMISPDQAATLRRMMKRVVWENGGTAKGLKSNLVTIAGKTGTARIAKERPVLDEHGDSIDYTKVKWKGGYRENAYRVAFCGFFPYEKPKYTCMVVISNPKGPHRGPAASAGTVLKNVALKLYARSMLTDNPEYQEVAQGDKKHPTVYSSFDNNRIAEVSRQVGLPVKRFRHPDTYDAVDAVPDVRGVSLREAVACLERKNFEVEFNGTGYVAAQSPQPGTLAANGSKVVLTLKYD